MRIRNQTGVIAAIIAALLGGGITIALAVNNTQAVGPGINEIEVSPAPSPGARARYWTNSANHHPYYTDVSGVDHDQIVTMQNAYNGGSSVQIDCTEQEITLTDVSGGGCFNGPLLIRNSDGTQTYFQVSSAGINSSGLFTWNGVPPRWYFVENTTPATVAVPLQVPGDFSAYGEIWNGSVTKQIGFHIFGTGSSGASFTSEADFALSRDNAYGDNVIPLRLVYDGTTSNVKITDKLTATSSSAGVSGSGECAIRANSNLCQFSQNGGSWTAFGSGGGVTIGGPVSGGSNTDTLYVDGSTNLAQSSGITHQSSTVYTLGGTPTLSSDLTTNGFVGPNYGGTSTNLPSVSFTAPSFSNGYGNFGAPLGIVGYLKNASGEIVLRGAASGGTPGAIIFTLPADFRPGAQLNLVTDIDGGPNILIINTAGQVFALSGGSTAVVFDNIRFYAQN